MNYFFRSFTQPREKNNPLDTGLKLNVHYKGSEDCQDVFTMSFVHSIYVLYPGASISEGFMSASDLLIKRNTLQINEKSKMVSFNKDTCNF